MECRADMGRVGCIGTHGINTAVVVVRVRVRVIR